jgi:hypothetical protein
MFGTILLWSIFIFVIIKLPMYVCPWTFQIFFLIGIIIIVILAPLGSRKISFGNHYGDFFKVLRCLQVKVFYFQCQNVNLLHPNGL